MNEKPHRIVANAAGAVDQTGHNDLTAPTASFQPPRTTLEFALRYAELGWFVFPLWPIHRDASGLATCGCGNSKCLSVGKHPRIKWKAGATCDPETVRAFWTRWPEAGIGIATGAVSGIIVLDIDGPKGLEALRRLEAELGPLPRGPTVKTARGWHRYFKSVPDEFTRCSAVDGLDVRGDGGYVVAPPSSHASGHTYRWVADAS
jgi:putative DNA primase/helicase